MISGFQFTVGAVCGIGFVVKAAISQWAAETLVEEKEQKRHLNAFGCEAVSVTAAVTFQ